MSSATAHPQSRCLVYRYQLPGETDLLAMDLSNHLHVPGLVVPVAIFLKRANQIDGLGALAMAVRAEDDVATMSVYAFTDLAEHRATGQPASNAMDRLDVAHDELGDAVDDLNIGLATDLWYVPSPDGVVQVAHSFGPKLLYESGRELQSIPLPVNETKVAFAVFAEFSERG